MIVTVRTGDVHVSSVVVRAQGWKWYTVEIATPGEPHPAISFGEVSREPSDFHLSTFIDLYPSDPLNIARNPSRVWLTPENKVERHKLGRGLAEIDKWSRWSALLMTIPAFGEAQQLIAKWDPPHSVDYLR